MREAWHLSKRHMHEISDFVRQSMDTLVVVVADQLSGADALHAVVDDVEFLVAAEVYDYIAVGTVLAQVTAAVVVGVVVAAAGVECVVECVVVLWMAAFGVDVAVAVVLVAVLTASDTLTCTVVASSIALVGCYGHAVSPSFCHSYLLLKQLSFHR